MKQSTTQDRVYLTECLHFHERRLKECCDMMEFSLYRSSVEITDWGMKAAYHRRQVKWFKAKLQGYFRSTPIANPERNKLPPVNITVPPIPAIEVVPYTPPPTHELFTQEEFDRLTKPAVVHEVEPIKPAPWYIRAYNKLRGF